MRPIVTLFALTLSVAPAALAGDSICLGGNCPEVDAAVREALADVGLPEIDSFTLVTADDGSMRVLVASDDLAGLRAVATLTGTEIAYVRGLELGFLAIPFSGGTTITIGGLASDPGGVAHTDTNMDGPTGCKEVCECTEDGVNCWTVCP